MQSRSTGPPASGFLLRDGLISFATLLLAFAAFDDITTDNATRFPAEYTALVACAAWFGLVAARLIRLGRRTLGILSLVALLVAVWALRGLGPGTTSGLWPKYVAMIAVFLWFLTLAATLVVLGRRGVRRPAVSQH